MDRCAEQWVSAHSGDGVITLGDAEEHVTRKPRTQQVLCGLSQIVQANGQRPAANAESP